MLRRSCFAMRSSLGILSNWITFVWEESTPTLIEGFLRIQFLISECIRTEWFLWSFLWTYSKKALEIQTWVQIGAMDSVSKMQKWNDYWWNRWPYIIGVRWEVLRILYDTFFKFWTLGGCWIVCVQALFRKDKRWYALKFGFNKRYHCSKFETLVVQWVNFEK